MAIIDSYRNNLSSKQNDLTRLLTDKGKEQKKISDTTGKINRASEAINRTKSTSTIQSKLREKGTTMVPVKLFFNERGFAKIQIAVARGKKMFDKREDVKKKDAKREMDRVVR